ncbi:EF-hand domain-containing protein [Asticcacaulis sp. YBE204]|uniref:EF-hand domain-containing protein n=1 Tax=Asticcacaulis sp. YBE204 TaxID=1282363 RepID=UPI0003C40B06|nr:EF-hand domain-containing protein [Asticcacaulis sp. YBE204]ESQ79882.1 hypothetical protein AEYBE204_08530 [Asticcacaulis sp. YBE204]
MSPAFVRTTLIVAGLLVAAAPAVAQKQNPVPTQTPDGPWQKKDRPPEALRERFEQRFFEKLDANRDGVVSRDEFRRQADERFDKLDANKDGKLSREEIRAEVHKGPDKNPPKPQ